MSCQYLRDDRRCPYGCRRPNRFVCHRHMRGQSCRHGDRCRFMHRRPEASSSSSSSSSENLSTSETSREQNVPHLEMDAEDWPPAEPRAAEPDARNRAAPLLTGRHVLGGNWWNPNWSRYDEDRLPGYGPVMYWWINRRYQPEYWTPLPAHMQPRASPLATQGAGSSTDPLPVPQQAGSFYPAPRTEPGARGSVHHGA